MEDEVDEWNETALLNLVVAVFRRAMLDVNLQGKRDRGNRETALQFLYGDGADLLEACGGDDGAFYRMVDNLAGKAA